MSKLKDALKAVISNETHNDINSLYLSKIIESHESSVFKCFNLNEYLRPTREELNKELIKKLIEEDDV